jgi:hypothetical protein
VSGGFAQDSSEAIMLKMMRIQVRADDLHRGDDHDRDQAARDPAVLDGGDAVVVAEERLQADKVV